ncbi:MAG: protein kinase, partial [Deltaproteobacteria bacterium]|nr:protein kinase [Deltaproteobacteria bacterium]
ETLRERMGMGVQESVRIALAVAEALVEAHGNGILHRDLKPENVLLGRDGRVRVVDFGLAKSVLGPEGEVAETMKPGEVFQSVQGEVIGTPMYMAPEQWRAREVGPPADVWALGIMLHEMLAGHHPFGELGMYALCAAATSDDPVQALGEDVAPELRQLVAGCVDKDPGKRPAPQEIVSALEGMLHGGKQRGDIESPFRGLLPFTEKHSDLFFGRDSEVSAFVERLRQEPVLPVVGPSGAGKSSFVMAGVIPRLREQGRWLTLVMRPGSRPFQALSSRLHGSERSTQFSDHDGCEVDPPQMTDMLLEAPSRLALFLGQLAETTGSKVLLYVDQLEELYTLVEDEKVRTAFMEALCLASDDPDGPVRVVFSLRDDFLGKLAGSTVVREALSHVTVLRTPGPGAMKEIIEKPLRVVGYGYEEEGLVEEMVRAVRGEAAGLPLLQFACSQLWERRDEKHRQLTREAYEELGGVEGALAHHADGVLEGLSGAELEIAREIFLKLVTGEGTRRTVTRSQLLGGLAEDAGAVLDRLIQSRIVTLRKSHRVDVDDAELELAHESLIARWSRLRRWIEESHEDLAFVDEAMKAAELWRTRGRPDEEAWTGEALHDAQRKAGRLGHVDPIIGEFLEAGRALSGRRTRRRRLVLAAAVATLAIVAVVLALMYVQARDQRIRADELREASRLARADAVLDAARISFEQGHWVEASARLRFAITERDSVEARALWNRLGRVSKLWQIKNEVVSDLHWSPTGVHIAAALGGPRMLVDSRTGVDVFTKQENEAMYAGSAISPDGRHAAACGSHLVVTDIESGEDLVYVEYPGSFCGDLEYAGSADHILALDDRLMLVLLDARSGKILHQFDRPVRSFDAGSDGTVLLRDRDTRRASLWSVGEEGFTHRVDLGDNQCWGLDLDRDGRVAATLHEDGSLRIWNTRDGKLQKSLDGFEQTYASVALQPGGARVAVWTGGESISIYEVRSGLVTEKIPYEKSLMAMQFDPVGKRLVTGSMGGTLEVFRVGVPDVMRKEQKHLGLWFRAAVDPRGEILASVVAGSGDILLWDLETGQGRGHIVAHDRDIYDLAFSPDGRTLASASQDRTVRIWSVPDGSLTRILAGHEAAIMGVSFSIDGTFIATASADSTAGIWDVGAGTRLHTLEGHAGPVFSVAFSPDGTEIATNSNDGSLRLWDSATGVQKIVALEGLKYRQMPGIAYSPDGARIAHLGPGESIMFFDRQSGEVETFIEQVRRDFESAIYLNEIQFSSDGKLLGACPGDTHERRVWDVETGEEILSLINATGPGGVFLFAPEDRYIVSEDCYSLVTWNLDGSRHWRSTLLLPEPLAVHTHMGWIDPATGEALDSIPQTAWREAVERRAVHATVTDDAK